MMISSIIVWSTSNKGENSFTLEKLLYCYRPSQGKKVGYWYLSPKETGRSTITNMPSSNRIWTTSFFILSKVGQEHSVRVQINAVASLCGKKKRIRWLNLHKKEMVELANITFNLWVQVNEVALLFGKKKKMIRLLNLHKKLND